MNKLIQKPFCIGRSLFNRTTSRKSYQKEKKGIKLLLFFIIFFGLRSFGQITPATMQQIQLLLNEKNSRTPSQRKIDSHLLQAVRENRGEKMVAGVNLEPARVNADASGVLIVDIKADITDAFLSKITSLGGKIIYASAQYHTVRASLNLTAIETISDYSEVKFIEPAVKSIVVDADMNKLRKTTSYADRVAKVRAQLTAYLNSQKPLIGSVTSQGDADHRAPDVRSAGYQGQGIKIGVLSDSYNALGGAAADVASGDLPGTGNPDGHTTPVTVVQDFSGGEDEGRAMLQIIHDLAPKATLYFATADVSEAGFATNIQTLRNTYNCNIIIDDVSYLDEPAFQDGIVAQAVDAVTASGALYFSAAGNSGSLAKGTSGVFEGDFNDAGSLAFSGDSKAGTVHNFGTVSAPVNGDIIINPCPYIYSNGYTLNWSDPWGTSTNDYDLFLVSSTGAVIASSTNAQTGTQNPYESVSSASFASGYRLVIFRTTTAAIRAIHLNTNRGTLTVATNGQTSGHACAINAFCMAATPAASAFESGYPTGPYPSPFVSTNKVEPFSSDGPRRIFYNPNGTAITAGNFLFGTNGGTSLAKPDLTAADGVSTTLPTSTGLNPFFGTSCAGPHAGAIAALLLSANPSLTTAQIRTILTSTALDIEGTGYDNNSGYGIVQAYQATQQIVAPKPTITIPTCTSNAAGATANITVSNYPGSGTYTLSYTGSTGNTDFLTDGNYTPTGGIISIPVKSGTVAGATGVYNLVYNSPSSIPSLPVTFGIGIAPLSIAVSGTTTCLNPSGWTTLTASPAVCSTCTYNWNITSGGGTISPVTNNTANYYTNGRPATVTASYCGVSSTAITMSPAPPVPTLDKSEYCLTGSSVNITVTNYSGVGNYELVYFNVGQTGYSDFLVDGYYTPNSSGVITIPVNGTATPTSIGVYQLFYNSPSCGLPPTNSPQFVSFTVGTLPTTVNVTGTATCLYPSGWTTLTASPTLCSTCTYNWAITSGAGTLSSSTGNPVNYYTNGQPATITATYQVQSGCSISSAPVTMSPVPPVPTLDKSLYCITGSSVNITVTNYLGVGNYELVYFNVGQTGYSDFLVDGYYTPNSSGVITIPINGTATSTSTGVYQLLYNSPTCGTPPLNSPYFAEFTAGTTPATINVTGTTTCLSTYGSNTLTASQALCSTCSYTWATNPLNTGTLSGQTGNTIVYGTSGQLATVTATYNIEGGCSVSSTPTTMIPSVPIVTLPSCVGNAPNATEYLTVDNYSPASNYNYAFKYMNIGAPGYTDFLQESTRVTPTLSSGGAWVVPLRANPTNYNNESMGIYQLINNSCPGSETLPLTFGAAPPFTVSFTAATKTLLANPTYAPYTWYNSNTGVDLASSSYYTLTSPSSGANDYFSAQTTINGCTYSSSYLVPNYIARPTIGNENAQDISTTSTLISIYPNPNQGQFTINIQQVNDKASVNLYDNNGKLIREISLVQGTNQVNATDLANGEYNLIIWVDGNSYPNKIIIAK